MKPSCVKQWIMVCLAGFLLLLVSAPAGAADAPGAPGVSSAWTTGAKEGIGTSTTLNSKVWHTLAQGILTEVYYPTLDVPNVQDLQFMVSDGSSFLDLERDATAHQVQLIDPQALTFRQINTAKSGRYRITKTYVTDPDRSTLLVEARFQALSGGPYQVYVLYNPSLNNSGLGDTASTSGNALVASDGSVASALVASSGFLKMTSGYSGRSSDGFVDLSADKHMDGLFDSASTPGNIVQTGQIKVGSDTTFVLALGFGNTREDAVANATTSLATSFSTHKMNYESGWHSYIASLKPPPNSVTSTGLTTQYHVALMALKAHEDKTFRGASVAALATPWGQVVNADHCCPHGYHAVWARDLYQVATAQLAAGDAAAANRALDYLLNVQQRPDGSFPQNTRVDGGATTFNSLQLDEVAFPIVLAWQLNRTDATTWGKLKKSADFVVSRGPSTPQERWEEEGGFSPSTIAAQIAALVCAADIAKKNGDTTASNAYLAKADDWQRNIENWTFTTSGLRGDGRYYLRIENNQNPNDGQTLDINNGGGPHDERDIVDAGFLELVRLGVKAPNDAKVAASLPEIDATIKVDTPNGTMFYRYNFDGYGERSDGQPFLNAGVGRLWPLLSGERGEYELANGRINVAKSFLATMAKAANDGFMIPEQAWDSPDGKGRFTFGEGTDSATPLAWAMAQFIRLALSIDAGHPVETPAVVADRYGGRLGSVSFTVTVPANTDSTGRAVFFAGELDKLDPPGPVWNPSGSRMTRLDATHWQVTLGGRAGTLLQYKYALGDWAFVEKSAPCSEVTNRTVILAFDTTGNQAVNDTVPAWAGVPPCAVQATLTVTVPASTDATGRAVFIAGTLNRLNGSLPAWNPASVQLTRIDATHWQVTLSGREGTEIEYKYALGDWPFVEKSSTCAELSNRRVTLSFGAAGGMNVSDTVGNWRNVSPCGN